MKTDVKIRKTSLKTQFVASFIAIVCSVALPQIFHIFGKGVGIGTSLGEIFLPIQIPIIIVGLIAGPVAGAVSGLAAPFVSTLLTGMPLPSMLPVIAFELCAYGAIAGYLKDKRINSILKVLAVQFFGRVLRGAFIAILVFAFDYGLDIKIIYTSSITGAVGIVLQLVFIPIIISAVKKAEKNEM